MSGQGTSNPGFQFTEFRTNLWKTGWIQCRDELQRILLACKKCKRNMLKKCMRNFLAAPPRWESIKSVALHSVARCYVTTLLGSAHLKTLRECGKRWIGCSVAVAMSGVHARDWVTQGLRQLRIRSAQKILGDAIIGMKWLKYDEGVNGCLCRKSFNRYSFITNFKYWKEVIVRAGE